MWNIIDSNEAQFHIIAGDNIDDIKFSVETHGVASIVQFDIGSQATKAVFHFVFPGDSYHTTAIADVLQQSLPNATVDDLNNFFIHRQGSFNVIRCEVETTAFIEMANAYDTAHDVITTMLEDVRQAELLTQIIRTTKG